ncbi:helix-turn-helix domain-containing protein [Streptococcus pluranimalium]|uniref:helix-turn-helix domain-containing protein n=1 Tax=Streptococcus pluranimalium TaxID=82348 RepID=UPI002414EDC5|nr:helix-turn-helix transcriptional regulator [Streptococcus pluranimalium]WFM79658.1 helix-turn-helix transcriptional regulator [Streptococcus pluranimalium]
MDENKKLLIGNRIRDIRLALGDTMEAFGERFNTSKGTVNNWEKGRNLPNKSNLKKIAELGNTSVKDLIDYSLLDYLAIDNEELKKKYSSDEIEKLKYVLASQTYSEISAKKEEFSSESDFLKTFSSLYNSRLNTLISFNKENNINDYLDIHINIINELIYDSGIMKETKHEWTKKVKTHLSEYTKLLQKAKEQLEIINHLK